MDARSHGTTSIPPSHPICEFVIRERPRAASIAV